MMAFVKDGEAEPVAVIRRVHDSGLIGRHRNILQFVLTATIKSDLLFKVFPQHCVPLVHEIDCRHVYECGALRVSNE